ncbi:MAG: PBP1A family penicillin-binding protein, partial [Lachnospiraceae bacterium]|nr:PBP1A family penicillin-binding protein [Lachnospiraceae bacterium]
MNYDRYHLNKKIEKLKHADTGAHLGVVAIRLIVFLAVAAVVVITALSIGSVHGIIANAPDIDDINFAPTGFATFIYDTDGNQMQKLTTSDSNRTAVSLEKIPEDLQHAVVAIEDERFYEHKGIDPQGIVRALFVGVTNNFRFTEGASTITQQLLKNNVFTTWTSEKSLMDRVKRKFQEQYLAVLLEEKLDNKNLILENYLNTINLGAGTYGVQAASRKYFNKDVSELTLSECAVIAGITQNPSRYNPIRHPDENAERRERVLTKMVEQGYISEAEKNEALADPVYQRIAISQNNNKTNTVYSYFVDELISQVKDDLMREKGYSETQAYQMLYSGGLRIYTTQDPAMQAIMDEEYTNEENFPAGVQFTFDWALSVRHSNGELQHFSKEQMRKWFRENVDPEFNLLFNSSEEIENVLAQYKAAVVRPDDEIVAERISYAPQPQSSMVIMDQHTGQVKALVGGRGEKTASLTLNRATDSKRQPGSTFKVVSTYAPAIDRFGMDLSTPYVDEPYNYATGRPVRDWSGDNYMGPITIRQAIAQSVNVVAVKCLTDIGPHTGYEQLLRFGFTTLDEEHDALQPLALGGIYYGVTNLELTAAYASIANNGVYTKPIFYTRIEDQYGNIVLENTPEVHEAIKPETAYQLQVAMQDVVNCGTGGALRLACGMPVAGKTGTTSRYNDVWFVGYTPYLTCGVWAGYDNGEYLGGADRDYHKVLWNKVMNRIASTQPLRHFTAPEGVNAAYYDGLGAAPITPEPTPTPSETPTPTPTATPTPT